MPVAQVQDGIAFQAGLVAEMVDLPVQGVGKDPQVLAEAAGVSVSSNAPMLYAETDANHPFVVEEQMMPMIPVTVVRDFDEAVDAPSLTLSPTASGYVNQFVHNLTGDASARVNIGSGALTVTTDNNNADGYSGLNLGTFNGTLSGAGTLVKDGDATLTLGGGSSNASFTGDVAVAAGSLQLATANRLNGAGAVILNAGTSLTAEGDQTLRALYGSAETSVSVNGVLTLGANAAPATGEIRPNVSNNLGTSTSETLAAGDPAASFSRFQNCYDREGNLILKENAVPESSSFANQKEATSAYLGAVAKTAYSGYDASALRSFIGKENYYAEDKKVFTPEDYDALIAYAENGGRDGLTNNSGVDYKTLLGDLAWLYDGLARTAEYEAAFAPTATSNGYWSPAGMKNLFASTQAYNEYVAGLNAAVREAYEKEYGEALPSNPTVSEKKQINAVLFDVLCEKYDELVGEEYWETGDYSYDALAGHFSGIEIDGGFGMALENADIPRSRARSRRRASSKTATAPRRSRERSTRRTSSSTRERSKSITTRSRERRPFPSRAVRASPSTRRRERAASSATRSPAPAISSRPARASSRSAKTCFTRERRRSRRERCRCRCATRRLPPRKTARSRRSLRRATSFSPVPARRWCSIRKPTSHGPTRSTSRPKTTFAASPSKKSARAR